MKVLDAEPLRRRQCMQYILIQEARHVETEILTVSNSNSAFIAGVDP
ncbi:MAG: hypothetical protein ACK56W_13270 [Pirellula sp.]|nr:hypothetical protein [Pirellula sp.]